MFEKTKQTVDGIKEGIQQKKLERSYERKQRELEAEREREERLKQEQENKRIEIEKIKEEYDRLSSLNDKQLMAELIFAVRGFYSEFEELKQECTDLSESISSLEGDISCLEDEIDSLRSEMRNSSYNYSVD